MRPVDLIGCGALNLDLIYRLPRSFPLWDELGPPGTEAPWLPDFVQDRTSLAGRLLLSTMEAESSVYEDRLETLDLRSANRVEDLKRRQMLLEESYTLRKKAALLTAADWQGTLTTPKPVVPVVDRPLLRHQLDLLAGAGVREVVFSVAYRPERVEAVSCRGRRWRCADP